jgi:DNA-binding NarL/FixJ family response regulator
MNFTNSNILRRVLIASSHPLFGEGLRSLLNERWGGQVVILGRVTDINEAMDALDTLNPNLVIVDYDDDILNREQFLMRFMEKKQEIRVVLLSLKDGNEGEEATVYDRRTLVASRIDDWLQQRLPERKISTEESGDDQ